MVDREQIEEFQAKIKELESNVKWLKEHTEALDANWSRYNAMNLNYFRQALELSDDASIPDMLEEIRNLKTR